MLIRSLVTVMKIKPEFFLEKKKKKEKEGTIRGRQIQTSTSRQIYYIK